MIDSSKPAYPTVNESGYYPGLSIREELIFRIAAGMAANECVAHINLAHDAIIIADAVLAEMNKEKA